jgi:hypothetical protein
MDCDDPTIGPRGRLIAARCVGDHERNGVYVANFPPDNRAPVRVIQDEVSWVEPVSWLPSGDTLLVRRGDEGKRELLLIEIDEGGQSFSEPRPATGVPQSLLYAGVSPSGRQIALISWDGTQRQIAIAPWTDGEIGAPRPIADLAVNGMLWAASDDEDEQRLVVSTGQGEILSNTINREGRVIRTTSVPGKALGTGHVRSLTYFSDGRVLTL